VVQNTKADGVNVTPIIAVASIYLELLENRIDMEKIDADLVDDCTDKSVIEYLESVNKEMRLSWPSKSKPKSWRRRRLLCWRRIRLFAL
jgi:hypothetical protein